MIEYKLLGIVLNNIELFDDLINYGNLFIDSKCNRLFEIIAETKVSHGKINKELIEDYIKESRNFDLDTFYEIHDSAWEEENYSSILSKVITKNLEKQVKDYVKQMKPDNKNYIDIKQELQNILDSVRHIEDAEIKNTKDACYEMLGKLKDDYKPRKILSCIDFIDEAQGGYDETDYIIIGGAESCGKTSRMLDLILRQMRKGLKIALFSCEMRKEKIQSLMACRLAGIDSSLYDLNIMDKAQKNKFANDGLDVMYDKPIFIDDTSREWNDIRRKIKILKKRENIDIVYIDYLQYIRCKGIKTAYDRLEEVSTGIKNLAKEIRTPIVCVAALNRTGKQEDIPQNHHIKGNGDIEYDADVICLLKTKQMAIDGDFNKRLVTSYITKNRNGRLGKEDLIFYPAVRRYKKWTGISI